LRFSVSVADSFKAAKSNDGLFYASHPVTAKESKEGEEKLKNNEKRN